MKINVGIKSISRTRGIDFVEYDVGAVKTLREIIVKLVNIEIDKYESEEIRVLNQNEIDELVDSGKVSFGFRYNESEVDREEAVRVAIEAFNDGLYRVFIDKSELCSLDEELNINGVFTFIRLTMLAGRFF